MQICPINGDQIVSNPAKDLKDKITASSTASSMRRNLSYQIYLIIHCSLSRSMAFNIRE
jgi:hypothetical protein